MLALIAAVALFAGCGGDDTTTVINETTTTVVGDSTYRDRWDLLATDSADFAFALRVPENAVPGTPIVITAGTINDQLLSDLVVDTAFVAQAP